ncbi:hypothetical protein [Sphingomonas melonis]|uniref:hypothetical protein n=1 Tax=Sphingomonas melonis TaxID=152682 RepID=UPI0035C7D297
MVAEHFDTTSDMDGIIDSLDGGLFNVGMSVRALQHAILDPDVLTDQDRDTFAATTDALLAYLGHLGTLIDLLGAAKRADIHHGAEAA